MFEPAPRPWWKRLLSGLGIILPSETGQRSHFSPRFYVIAGVVVVLFALNGLVHYSESPAFCRSCHIMEPYYQAWHDSKHKSVACVECHYPPSTAKTHMWHKFQALSQVVKYVTRTYSSRPYAEVDDASCLRSGCHSTRLLNGKIVTKTGIHFDHRPHLTERRRGRQLRCVSCHSQVMVGRHIEVTYDSCILCHFSGRGTGREIKPIGGCTGCHALPAKDFKLGNMTYNHRDFVLKRKVACTDCHSDVIGGTGKVEQDRCIVCHNQPEKLKRFNDIPFIHDNHVTKHHVACFHCHEPMRHGNAANLEGVPLGKPGRAVVGSTPRQAEMSSSAQSELMARSQNYAVSDTGRNPGYGRVDTTAMMDDLHGQAGASDCNVCHEAKHAGTREMYSGKVAGIGLPGMPSPMSRANVDCIACHYRNPGGKAETEFRGRDWRASEAACIKCHGPKFKGIWQDTRKEFQNGVDQLNRKLAAAETTLAKAPLQGAARRAAATNLKRAGRWIRFVRESRGEHNVYLASLALRKSNQQLDEAGAAMKAKLADLSDSPLISGGYCATLCHSKIGVKVPPVTVHAFGKKMPHKDHAEQMGCVKCHDIGGHKQVPLKHGIKAICAECHEKS